MKSTFTTWFRSKAFVRPPLTLPVTSPVNPHGPDSVRSPGLLPQPPGWSLAFTLPPADSAHRGRQGGAPAPAQNLSVVPSVTQKARQDLHDLPHHRSGPPPPPSFLTLSVPAALASGGSPHLLATVVLQDFHTCHARVLHTLPTDLSTLHCLFPFRLLLKSHLPVRPTQVQPRRPQPPLDLETV